jgi:FkbM family methyltransferase
VAFIQRACLRGLVAAYRDNVIFRGVATLAEKYLRAFNNEANWAFCYNGEQWALQQILDHHEGCLFDVGANVGAWTLMAHRIDSSRTIHAFEISPLTFQSLAQNVIGLDNCVLNAIGLSDQEGELKLQYYLDSPDRSSLIALPDNFVKETQKVRVLAGDAYISAHAIDKIAFLKIDVEGHEMAVLKGLRETLETGQIAAIQFEHGPAHVLSHHSLGDFDAFLSKHNYDLFRIFPRKLEPFHYNYTENYGPGNYLAIRRGAS